MNYFVSHYQILLQDKIDIYQDLIQSLTNTPVLGCLPYLDNLADLDQLAYVASTLQWERLR